MTAPVRRLAPPRPILVSVGLVAAALVGWLVLLDRMRGMDAGPGTDLGSLGWFLGIWVTMTAAMMLPAAAPMTVLFSRTSNDEGARTVLFVAGYLLVWTGYGLGAYAVYRALRAGAPAFVAWDRQGPYVAGAALGAAGLYELTPLKSVCLRHCRSPLHFLLHRWHGGPIGAARMGAEHGAYCVGCCWGLMLALFALGVMSLVWMILVTVLIFAEKVLPFGERLARLLAVALVLLGVWVAAAPGSVPGLTQPGSPPIQERTR